MVQPDKTGGKRVGLFACQRDALLAHQFAKYAFNFVEVVGLYYLLARLSLGEMQRLCSSHMAPKLLGGHVGLSANIMRGVCAVQFGIFGIVDQGVNP
ncbi:MULTISPECIES: hypothetical protein [Sinorhizobium/Ensifer group]|uniref:hypothetical protein n=1 Tax=Sinorhizobium/Ensifer group TaxID=227292 RepID=UPI0011158CCD|nr:MULTISPECIES: hypothetical protein [Sinorhizobium/Ensifer group]